MWCEYIFTCADGLITGMLPIAVFSLVFIVAAVVISIFEPRKPREKQAPTGLLLLFTFLIAFIVTLAYVFLQLFVAQTILIVIAGILGAMGMLVGRAINKRWKK